MLNHPDNTACCPGYLLRVCLPANGSHVNRAVLTRDEAGFLLSIEEQYDICAADVGVTFTGEELTSLNVFGFRRAHLPILEQQLSSFLADLETERATDRAAPGKKHWSVREFILADVVNALQTFNMATAVLGPTMDIPLVSPPALVTTVTSHQPLVVHGAGNYSSARCQCDAVGIERSLNILKMEDTTNVGTEVREAPATLSLRCLRAICSMTGTSVPRCPFSGTLWNNHRANGPRVSS